LLEEREQERKGETDLLTDFAARSSPFLEQKAEHEFLHLFRGQARCFQGFREFGLEGFVRVLGSSQQFVNAIEQLLKPLLILPAALHDASGSRFDCLLLFRMHCSSRFIHWWRQFRFRLNRHWRGWRDRGSDRCWGLLAKHAGATR
jgi:hypothetical protein